MNQQAASVSKACKTGILNDVAIRNLCSAPDLETIKSEMDEVYEESYPRLFPKGARLGPQDILAENEYFSTRVRRVKEIAEKYVEDWRPMIAPFEPGQVRKLPDQLKNPNMVRFGQRVISYGTTSFGYDVTLDEAGFKIFSGMNVSEIDPMEFDEECLVDATVRTCPKSGLKYILLPPHSYGLGVTREYFHMPRDVVALCIGKSTYARAGVLINATPIEPGFAGNVVIEVANLTPIPARIYLNTGIAQFLFFRGEEECETSYADRGGKYMGQRGIQLPLI